jgi:c-di-GMP-binding flagellar brake protein YcgR
MHSVTEPSLFFAQPKDFDKNAFLQDLEKTGSRFCFFSVSLPKANIFFKSKFINFDTGVLKFHVPDQVYAVQRRKDVRLPIPPGYVVKVEFDDPILTGQKMNKKVIDISATGLSFLAAANEEVIFQTGVRLKEMAFSIKSRKITVEGEVRHTKTIKTRYLSGLKVGVQFTSILPGESQHIAGYVFEETRKFYTRIL